jgi:E3 ubiquitin-protein ligase HUWE1
MTQEDKKLQEENIFSTSQTGFAPFERTALLKSAFKFILHMMQSSVTTDGLRNLIESSLPAAIKVVLQQAKTFGSNIYAYGKRHNFSLFHHTYLTSRH